MRILATTAALALLVTGPAVAADSTEANLQATAVKGFKSTVKTTVAGNVHRNKMRVLGGTPRTVEVQSSRDGSIWKTRKVLTTRPNGRVKVRMKVKPKRNRWRVFVPATDAYGPATSPVKTFAVQKPDPAEAFTVEDSKAYARAYILAEYGWGDDQWEALEQLWTKESGWNHLAVNPYSGATGIPQALPGDKMASHGADWKTNPKTQIHWGCWYIELRYQDPKGAWAHFLAENWY